MRSKKKIVVLVHGFNKDKKDMAYLRDGLRRHGFKVCLPDLPTTFGTLDECFKSISLQLEDIIRKNSVIHYVAHSMGGLITREFLDRARPYNTGHCVFIATPHNGAKMARTARRIPLFENVFKPVKTISENYRIKRILQMEGYGIGVIAGSQHEDFAGTLFSENLGDGRVSLKSAKPSDATDYIELPYGHKSIHHERETIESVVFFLRKGYFKKNGISY